MKQNLTHYYERVDKLIEKSPDFSNADYINIEKNVIVELKVIDKDFFNEGTGYNNESLVFTSENIIPKGDGVYSLKDPKFDIEKNNYAISEPLRRTIKKANKQLKETKNRFLNENAVGFLILAVNMKTFADPRLVQALTMKFLTKEFKSIDGVVICTPKTGIIHSNGHIQPICLHCQNSTLTEEYHNELMSLVDCWCYFVNNAGHDD